MSHLQGAPDPYPEPSEAAATAAGPLPRTQTADRGGALAAASRSRVGTAAAVIGLLLGLAVWGFFATEDARESWWELGEHVAVTPDEAGWASVDTLQVRLASVDPEVRVEPGYEAPAGFRYLELTFEVSSSEIEQSRSCTVEVLDGEGRLFLAGREVPGLGDGYVSELSCGTSDPAENRVPASQAMLVLLPDDAEPVAVRVDSREFPPATFVELPLP